MAIGAYTTAILVKDLGISFWLALPLGGITAAVIAMLIGIPTLKLKASYFFLVTFAMGEVIRLTFSYIWTPVFGGPSGISKIPPPDPISIPGLFTLEFVTRGSIYYLVLCTLLIAVLVMYRIDKSRIGAAILAVRDAEDLAEAVGIAAMRYKVFAFSTACFFAGIAGGIYAHYLSQVSPVSFTILQSVDFLAFVVVGGSATVLGPVLGTVLLRTIGAAVRGVGAYEVIFSGVLMILVIMFMPEGMLGVPRAVSSFIRRRLGSFRGSKEVKRGTTA